MQDYKKDYDKRILSHEKKTNAKLLELAKKLPEKAVVVDCGAHVGDTGIQLAKKLKSAGRSDIKIVEIEPSQDKCDFIEMQAKEEGVQDMIEVQTAGLWDKDCGGKVERTEGKKYSGQWKVREVPPSEAEVKLRCLDRMVERLDLLHLDVEGSEPQALTGMAGLVSKFKPDIIIEMNHSDSKSTPILKNMGYVKSGKRMDRDQLFVHKSKKKGEKQEGGKVRGLRYRSSRSLAKLDWRYIVSLILALLAVGFALSKPDKISPKFVGKFKKVAVVLLALVSLGLLIWLLTEKTDRWQIWFGIVAFSIAVLALVQDNETLEPKVAKNRKLVAAVFGIPALALLVWGIFLDNKEDDASGTSGGTIPTSAPGTSAPGTSAPGTQAPTPPVQPTAEPLSGFCTTGCLPDDLANAGEPLAITGLDQAAIDVLNGALSAKITEFGATNVSIPVSTIPGLVIFDEASLTLTPAQIQQLIDIVVATPGIDQTKLFYDYQVTTQAEGLIRFLYMRDDLLFTSDTFTDTSTAPNYLAIGYSLLYPGIPCSADC